MSFIFVKHRFADVLLSDAEEKLSVFPIKGEKTGILIYV